jgi:putative membrane protein
MRMTARGVLLSAAMMGMGCESEQRPSDALGQTPGVAGSVSSEDRQFVQEAAMANRAEIEMGKTGVQKARSQRVRQFAQRMIDDHTSADDELKQLASDKGLSVTASMGQHGSMMDKLSSYSGEAFDREYMRMMVDDHVKTVELFERQAQGGDDPELRSFAERTLSTLREHLRMAREIAGAMGVSAGS